jgi:hypothetical protein
VHTGPWIESPAEGKEGREREGRRKKRGREGGREGGREERKEEERGRGICTFHHCAIFCLVATAEK